jgi:choline dehydrogenase
MESYGGGEDEFRGRDGPLRVSDLDESGPLYDALIAAARENGIPFNADYNGAVQEGVSMTQVTIRKGRRMSTARCYLDPAKARSNLTIMTGAHTDGLTFDGKRCTGVRFTVNGGQREAQAGREVVVSAGSVNSPQLLELSGIGQPELLQRHGIEVRHALPGVGENLRDHFAPRMKWQIKAPGLTYNDKMRGIGTVFQALRYAFTGTGLLGLPASPIRAYVCSRPGLASPDVSIGWIPFLVADGFKLAKQSGVTVITHTLRSESTGSIHIEGGDSKAPPKIRFNFLSVEYDREVTLAGMRIVRKIMEAPAMAPMGGLEIAPGAAMDDDGELLQWVKDTAETAYHPIGTCKMGADDMAVVDDQLRVRGIGGLRVADASIMPTLTSGNTNAPSIMIGEKAAAMVLEAAA